MSMLYLGMALAFIVAAGGVAAFVWAANRVRFDDLQPSAPVAHDED